MYVEAIAFWAYLAAWVMYCLARRERKFTIAMLCLLVPCPLLSISGSNTGFVYMQDFAVAAYVAVALFRGRGFRGPAFKKWGLRLGACLVGYVGFSTALGAVLGGEKNPNQVALWLWRGLSVAVLFPIIVDRIERVPAMALRILKLQCYFVGGIMLLGSSLLMCGIDVDVWKAVGDSDTAVSALGKGFFGLYRGSIGAFAVYLCVACAVCYTFRILNGVMALCIGACGIFASMLSGSRIGILMSAMGAFLGVALSLSTLDPRRRFSVVCAVSAFAVGAALLGGIASSLIPEDIAAYNAERLNEASSRADGLVEAFFSRDPRFIPILEFVAEHPFRYVLGAGVGAEAEHSGDVFTVPELGEVSYTESEALWLFQEVGVVGMIFIGAMLTSIWRTGGRPMEGGALAPLGSALTRALILVSLLISWVHFSWTHFRSSNWAPALYLWSLLGIGVGLSGSRVIARRGTKLSPI